MNDMNNSNIVIAAIFITVMVVFVILAVLVFKQQGHMREPMQLPQLLRNMPRDNMPPGGGQGPGGGGGRFLDRLQERERPQRDAPDVIVVPPPVCPHDYHLDRHRSLYFMGYEDASCGRPARISYRDSIHYMRGYRDGSPYCPPALRFNIQIR